VLKSKTAAEKGAAVKGQMLLKGFGYKISSTERRNYDYQNVTLVKSKKLLSGAVEKNLVSVRQLQVRQADLSPILQRTPCNNRKNKFSS